MTAEVWAAENNPSLSEWPVRQSRNQLSDRTTLPQPQPLGKKTHCPVARV